MLPGVGRVRSPDPGAAGQGARGAAGPGAASGGDGHSALPGSVSTEPLASAAGARGPSSQRAAGCFVLPSAAA